MQNKDLSRFFPVNRASKKANQFVRYDENGNIEGVSGAIIEQDLLDPDFVPIANTYYKHIGPTGELYNLTLNITNGTVDKNYTKINTVSELSFIVIPENDYTLPTSITVANATYSYDNITGKITLSNPTADVVVNVVCESTSPKPVDASQIVVGNTYKQWVIYTNAKMVDEIAAYITSIQPQSLEEALELVTVGTTPQNRQPPIVIAKAENGVVILSIGLEDTHMVYFVALNGGTFSYFPTITEDGWYELELAGEEFNVTKLDLKDEPYTFDIGAVFLMPVDFISRKFDSLRSSIKGIKEE